jgi:hypothetical protein
MELLLLMLLLPKILIKKMMYKKKKIGRFWSFNYKNHLPMQLIESQWLNKFSLHLCPRLFYLLGNNLQKKFCWNWLKKLNNCMSYLLWQIIIL